MERDDYEEHGHFEIAIGDRQYRVPHHCPHRAGRLQHGLVNKARKTITCPLHHSVFCLESGAQIAGPECGPLDVKVQPIPGTARKDAITASTRRPATPPLNEDNTMHYRVVDAVLRVSAGLG